MVCANVPKKHPKWQNGIPQKVKWDTPNGVLGYEETGFQASEQGRRGRVLGGQGLRNMALRPRKTPQIVQKEKKDNPFCNFQGVQNSIICRGKNIGKSHSTPSIAII